MKRINKYEFYVIILMLLTILYFTTIQYITPIDCNKIINDNLPNITFCESNDIEIMVYKILFESLILLLWIFSIVFCIYDLITYLKLRKDKNNELQ